MDPARRKVVAAGDLDLAQTEEVQPYQQGAILLGQRSQAVRDRGGGLPDRGRMMSDDAAGVVLMGTTAVTGTLMVQAAVQSDRTQPRTGLAMDAAGLGGERDEHLLHRVVGIGSVRQLAPAHPLDHLAVAVHQEGERLLVVTDAPPRQ